MSQLPTSPAAGSQHKYFRSLDELELGPPEARMRYSFFLPETYSGLSPAPLILALHYGGPATPEIGREFAEILILPALGDLGAIIVAPNCPGRGWTDPLSEDAILKLLERVGQKFAVDPGKIVVAGFSMGALGTYHLAARHPNLFSAAIAVSGIPGREDIPLLGDVPIFAVQSTGDEIFPVKEAQEIFNEIKKRGIRIVTEIIQDVSHYRTAEYVPALKKAIPWLRRLWEEGEKRDRR